MKPLLPSETPGYAEAVARENLLRDTAFLCPGGKVEGFVLTPLTLRIYAELRLADSPYLPPFRTPGVADTVTVLWRLSPAFTRRQSGWNWIRFRWQVRKLLPPVPPLWPTAKAQLAYDAAMFDSVAAHARLVKQLREHLDNELSDRPRSGTGGGEPDFCSDMASIIDRLARAYGWHEEYILDLPLARIFQYLKCCRVGDYIDNVRSGLKAEPPIILNPSDRIIADYMAKENHRGN